MIIAADANLPALREAFPKGFDIITYENRYDLKAKIQSADILVCRSTLMVDQPLIEGTQIKLVATATSGSNHIDISFLSSNNIRLMTAKGANASAVADWALSILAHIQPQLSGNRIGIIGLGHVGLQLKGRLSLLNYELLTCDPFLKNHSNFIHTPLSELKSCDVVFIHANLHDTPPYPSNSLLNLTFLESLKPSCFIVNASRGGIVNETDLLHTDFSQKYCTDVYMNEPDINENIVNNAYLCTPHIAGHTVEAKINAIYQLSQAIHHLYHKPAPHIQYKKNNIHLDLTKQSWTKAVLDHYNPAIETLALKKAKNKKEAFLQLRKKHLRHSLT